MELDVLDLVPKMHEVPSISRAEIVGDEFKKNFSCACVLVCLKICAYAVSFRYSLQYCAVVIDWRLHRHHVVLSNPDASARQPRMKTHLIRSVDGIRIARRLSRTSATSSLAHHSRSWSNRGAF